MKSIKKKKKKYNVNLIKQRDSYKFEEIADLFNLHIRTVQSWHKKGLKVIDIHTRPYLVMGYDLKHFLKEQVSSRKIKLKDNEFNCRSCQKATKSISEDLSLNFTGRKLGIYEQVVIKGICPDCNKKLIKFSSDRKVKKMTKEGTFKELIKVITGNLDCSMKTDKTGDQK